MFDEGQFTNSTFGSIIILEMEVFAPVVVDEEVVVEIWVDSVVDGISDTS